MSVKRKVTVPRGSSRTARVYDGALGAPSAALPRDPVAELAERDHEDEDATGGEHQQDDLPPLLGGRLDSQQQMKDDGEHRARLSQTQPSTTRSAKLAELFPNSHQPCTRGCTNAVLRPYTSGITATRSATA